MRIVYFIPSLENSGGIERVLGVKTDYLIKQLNYDITIVTYNQENEHFFFKFNDSIKFIHLKFDKQPFVSQKNLFKSFLNKRRFQKKYKKKVIELLKERSFDFAISLGLGEEKYFLHTIKDGSKKILEFHFSHYYYYRNVHNASWIKKIMLSIYLKYLCFVFGKYDAFISLTKEDAREWKKSNNNVYTIFNPLTILPKKEVNLENKNAVSLGRLVSDKGFDMMIEAWKLVNIKHPDWKLNIFGSGELDSELLKLIKINGLESIVVLNSTISNVEEAFVESSIYLLSSRNEGLPLSLMESMVFGLPSVSFNCPYGPSELIDDGLSGFLVERDNVVDFARKICILIENSDLRKKMGMKAEIKSREYQLDVIMNEWNNFFNSLKEK
ncbi:glycosyltransferase family 4 protein [Myroides marinus]|uniref:glycosyltransferase family 4 protein n=1 Tax=Myroides marinus TaxID=703342 RepID=UPI002578B533|nr:glycosyltransferase family 4 protein [Myroides marinus]MDM1352171.1 glycosyltransferase family 4 protein [Myroides marinus]MDM1359390.1 glycosyltransferase family 4 protein [Myroides marinus]MDM1366501.1 glycosyltransferase family 4 protein [Myroides marinus]